MAKLNYNLTKSKFLSGLQCNKRLWLTFHNPDLAPPPSLKQKDIFNSGYEFEEIVMKRYPDGVRVEFKDPKEMLSDTIDLINNKTTTIFHATFLYNGIYIITDIIRRVSKDRWELKEIKCSTRIKDVHIPDLAIQKYILENNGIEIKDTYIIHINKGAIYPDFESMAIAEQTTDRVKEFVIEEKLDLFSKILSETTEPSIDIGSHCNKPYSCEFIDHCWKSVDKYSIFHIPNLRWKKKEKFYNSGIKTIQDIGSDTKISPKQREYINRILNETVDIDKEGLRNKLSELEYPLYFFDFETTSPMIPRWESTKPNETIPFQWSCHIMDKNGKLDHKEYLHPKDSDPRKPLSKQLIKCLGEKGSIIVYNDRFEKRILKYLINLYPDLSEKLLSIKTRVWDQLDIIKNYYKDYRFGNSDSLKTVLPIIAPDLDYKQLELSSGNEADIFWYEMLKETDENKKEETKKHLLEYCKLDTYAMVRIHNHLKELIK